MACGATLKRSLEFDPLHSPGQTPKRRRCMPMTLSPSTPPSRSNTNSPFGEVGPKLTSDLIAANLSMEIKRMHRRKQLMYSSGSQSPPHVSQSCSQESLQLSPACMDNVGHGQLLQPTTSTALFNALSPSKKDMPLFTFRQVSLFCERMLKERETQIREEYDSVLTCKLAEQYEAFLKFNHDQIQKRFGDTPASYVS